MRCRAGDEKRDHFVDTGIDTDYDGTVYICNSCFKDLCEHSGGIYFSKEQVDAITASISEGQGMALKIIERQEAFILALSECGINVDFFLKKVEEYGQGPNGSERSVELRDTNSEHDTSESSGNVTESSDLPTESSEPADVHDSNVGPELISLNPLLAGLKFD
jgi:hypothetical protein